MKKFLSAIMIFGMLLAIFTACGDDATKQNDVVDEVAEERDFEDTTFVFMSNWVNQFFAIEGFSDIGDHQLTRYKELKEKYNFNIKFVTEGEPQTRVTRAVASGTDIPDIVDTEAAKGYTMKKAGLLVPYEEISTINLKDEKWGVPNFIIYGRFDDLTYGTYPYLWLDCPHFAGIVMFNNELIKKLGLENPYELQENKVWTWDKFEQVLTNATITEAENPVIGMGVIGKNDLVKTAIFSNNGQLVKQDGNGVYSYALDQPEAIEGMDFIQRLVNNKIIKEISLPDFTKDKSVYLFSETWQGTVMSETAEKEGRPIYTMNDFGFLPFPNGPKALESTTGAYVHKTRRLNFVIDSSEHSNDDIGFMMDKMFSPLGAENPITWKERGLDLIFHHIEGYNNYLDMVNKVSYDYSVQLTSTYAKLDAALSNVYAAKKAPSELIEAVKTIAIGEIDRELNNVAE